jgi:hypothetical protein
MQNFLTFGLYPLLAMFSTVALWVIVIQLEKINKK